MFRWSGANDTIGPLKADVVGFMYICPHCESEEYCDDDPDDSSPYLWFCEHGNGMILVEVDNQIGK